MNIKMIGIDHNNAPIDIREKFSFTKAAANSALVRLKSYKNVSGAVLISTCNRMEIWVSYLENSPDLAGFLIEEKNLTGEISDTLLVKREGEEAVRHLFYLAGGLESMILGDDQILTQLKDALTQAREADSTDSYIEVLFRMAVSAGKKIRSEINFDKGNRSAAALAVLYFKDLGFLFKGKKCLVIGNGEMGKIAATTLQEAGADVTVTIRQYRSGIVCIPQGCKRINYGDRYEIIPQCDYVFSATSSPNFTITKDRIDKITLKSAVVFADLAVPRDIDPEIAENNKISLYDIDSLKINIISEQMQVQMNKAKEILEQEINSFWLELSSRTQLKDIKSIGGNFGEEVSWRMQKKVKKLSCSDEEKSLIYELAKSNSDKVMQKFMFALQKGLPPKEFSECMRIFKDIL